MLDEVLLNGGSYPSIFVRCPRSIRQERVARQAMRFEGGADGVLGYVEADAIERLKDVDEDRAVAAVFGHEDVADLVQHEKAVEEAVLDEDAVPGDIGVPADLRVWEARNEF